MERIKTRIELSEPVHNQLKAAALFVGNYNRDELANEILGGWLKKHLTVAFDGETIKLAERPNLKIDGENVKIVKVDLEGGETP